MTSPASGAGELEGIPRCSVRFAWVDRGRRVSAIGWTDEAGRFEILTWPGQFLPPDAVGELTAERWEGEAFARQSGIAARSRDVQLSGEPPPLDSLSRPAPAPWTEPWAVLRGRVEHAGGAVPGAYVQLFSRAAAPGDDEGQFFGRCVLESTRTRADGRFEIELRSPRPATLPPRELWVTGHRLGAARSGPLAITVGDGTPEVRLELGVDDGEVRGRLRLPRGLAASKAQLSVAHFGDRLIASDGSYSLPHLPAGRYVAHVIPRVHFEEDDEARVAAGEWLAPLISCPLGSAEPEPHQSFTFDVEAGAVTRRDVDLRGPQPYRLEGWIALDGCANLRHVDGTWGSAALQYGDSDDTVCATRIDADGRFTLEVDQPRTYRLHLSAAFPGELTWRVVDRVDLRRPVTRWKRDLAAGSLRVAPDWVEGELLTTCQALFWRGPGDLRALAETWLKDPISRARDFPVVPTGSVALLGSHPSWVGLRPLGTARVSR